MPKETAYYDLLGVSPQATPAEIKRAFRVLALKHHPDRAGGSDEATALFTRLRAVHDVLVDAERRAEYDALGDTGSLHGGDPHFDLSAAQGPRLTPEDIAAYEATYREGKDEEEDLVEFYTRFEGGVANVLDYIPYSDEHDLQRFVDTWDALIKEDKLEATPLYEKARKALLRRANRKKRKNKTGPPKVAGGEDALVAQILARRKKSEASFDDWADGLAARAEARLAEEQQKRAKKKPRKSASKKGRITKP